MQCVLTGKAQEVYSALTPEEGLDFDKVKSAILRAYELVPEAYHTHTFWFVYIVCVCVFKYFSVCVCVCVVCL